MITQLQNLGYIEKDGKEKCSVGCNCGSSKKDSCCGNLDIGVKIWNITEKGKKAISV